MQEVQAKFRYLKQLRHTEAETYLEECRAKLDEATQSAANYRKQIEPQLECMYRQLRLTIIAQSAPSDSKLGLCYPQQLPNGHNKCSGT